MILENCRLKHGPQKPLMIATVNFTHSLLAIHSYSTDDPVDSDVLRKYISTFSTSVLYTILISYKNKENKTKQNSELYAVYTTLPF